MTRAGLAAPTANLPMGGFKLTGLGPGSASTDSANYGQIAAVGVPSGTVLPFAGFTPPSGYFICDGRAISRTTYAALFVAIGTTWGSGDGSTTFNIPELRSRSMVGAGAGPGLTVRLLAASGGEETHLLTTPEIPSHNHTDSGHTHAITDPGHVHSIQTFQSSGPGSLAVQGTNFNAGGGAVNTASATTGITVQTGTANIQNTGGGGAHNNMHPFAAVNFIIKV